MPQANEYFLCDFAGYGRNRETHTPQKAVKPCSRNIKYNIRAESDEDVPQDGPENDSAAPSFAYAGGDAFSQSLHRPL